VASSAPGVGKGHTSLYDFAPMEETDIPPAWQAAAARILKKRWRKIWWCPDFGESHGFMSNLGPFSGANIQGVAMTLIPVRCLHCESDQVVKRGMTSNGKQRYLCQNEECAHGSFLLEYSDRGRLPQVKQQVVDMALNGNGVRDTARVLKISKDTVLSELKAKEDVLEPVSQALLSGLNPDDITAVVQRVDEAEVDEMWSYVGNKDEQR
jgi:transposase-like protein